MMKIDFLSSPKISRILKSALWPVVAGVVPLAALAGLMVFGFRYHQLPYVEIEGPLRDTNLVTFGFWIIWLMGLVLTAPLLGRAWCGVCPVGWVSDGARRLGGNRPAPPIAASFLPMAGVLVLVRLAIYRFRVNIFPDLTAVLILGFLVGGTAVGVLFRGRVFCRGWCPIGGMLGLFSRLSRFGIGVKDPEVCRQCQGKECLTGKTEQWEILFPGFRKLFTRRWRGCPVALYPSDKSRAKDCVACFQCHRNCPNDNVAYGWVSSRKWTALPLGGMTEVLFLLILTGSTVDIFLKVWPKAEGIAFAVPLAVGRLGGWSQGTMAVIGSLWSLVILPLVVVGIPLLAAGFLGRLELVPLNPAAEDPLRNDTGQRRTNGMILLAPALIPLVAAANLILAAVKINSRIAYLPRVIVDPPGVKTFLAMQIEGTLPVPGSLIPLPVLRWVVLAAAIGGAIWAWRLLGRVLKDGFTPQGRWVAGILMAIPLSILTVVIAGGVVVWLFTVP